MKRKFKQIKPMLLPSQLKKSKDLLKIKTFYATQFLQLCQHKSSILKQIRFQEKVRDQKNSVTSDFLDSLKSQIVQIEEQLDELEHEASYSLWKKSLKQFKLRNFLRGVVEEDIIENPEDIKQNYIDGQILPQLATVNERDKEGNVVQQIREQYKLLMAEERRHQQLDMAGADYGSNRRSLDALLNQESQRSSLLTDKERSQGVLPKLNDLRGLESMESIEGSILASDDRSSQGDRSFSKPLMKKELNNDPHQVVLNEEYVKNL